MVEIGISESRSGHSKLEEGAASDHEPQACRQYCLSAERHIKPRDRAYLWHSYGEHWWVPRACKQIGSGPQHEQQEAANKSPQDLEASVAEPLEGKQITLFIISIEGNTMLKNRELGEDQNPQT